jgi:ABC-type multidrug transport system ATPase subunit
MSTVVKTQQPAESLPATTPKVVLSVRNLVKRYRDNTLANDRVSLDVYEGELISILGHNGAGKTTLMRQITTELKPTSGEINIFGIDSIRRPQDVKRLMGVTPQECELFHSLTVREHLEFFGRLKGLDRKKASQRAERMIEELSMTGYAKKQVGHLSGGLKRRVMIGIALIAEPRILVLDEPTTGLDPASRREVWNQISSVVAAGQTVILTTHYMEEAERLSERIAIMQGGKLVTVGRLEDLYAGIKQSYRLSYKDQYNIDGIGQPIVVYGSSFAGLKAITEREGLAEFSIARVSLEDIYFELTGERLED